MNTTSVEEFPCYIYFHIDMDRPYKKKKKKTLNEHYKTLLKNI